MKQKTQTAFLVGMLVLFGTAIAVHDWRNPTTVQAQTQHYVSYPTLTLTGSRQQLNATGNCRVVQISAPGSTSRDGANSSSLIVGDANISLTGTGTGVEIVPGAARQIPGFTPNPSDPKIALSTLYVIGSVSDHVQFDCFN